MYFNGSSLVRLDLLRNTISSSRESIRFRFKTSHANGVLMYSRGTQGDYFALQLRDNQMLLNINLGNHPKTPLIYQILPSFVLIIGSAEMTSLSVGSLLDDNIWHDVVISRNRRDIVFSVDRVMIQSRIKGEFSKLDLNRAVSFKTLPWRVLYKPHC